LDYLPIFIDVRGRPCLVVGGGAVAARKVELLQSAGACLRIVAPEICGSLRAAVERETAQWAERGYAAADLQGMRVVIAATDDHAVNARVASDADALGIPVNVVDSPALCSFIMPAVIDRHPVLVAVSTAGASPVLARLVRTRIETVLPSRLGRLAEFAARHRRRAQHAIAHSTTRRRFWEMALDGAIGDAVLAGREDVAEQELLAALSRQAPTPQLTASIALIGVGDGAPDRQSLGAARWLASADVMLHDPAAAVTVRALGRRDAERIEIEGGVGGSGPMLPASGLSEAVLRAGRGQRVCLVRAGDPFADARAPEVELLATTRLHWIAFRPAPDG
jgi:uroporphyrin-III C-methyltransferase / precorrin-2 dehydrogenase / sirohydrochlorin ferrochelatase